jgi:hypothetical protein
MQAPLKVTLWTRLAHWTSPSGFLSMCSS